MRWIWLKLPEVCAGKGARRTRRRARDVVPHTPIVAAVEFGGSMASVLVSMLIGTSMAMAFTEYPETVSLERFTKAASSAALRMGGDLCVFKVSNAPPRSIQNGSSTVPAKTLIPLAAV